MSILYKNLTNEKYLQDFKTKGTLQVTSLAACRNMKGIGRDEKEGRKDIVLEPKEPIDFPDGLPREFSPANVNIEMPVHFGKGSHISLGSQIPDAYIFCVSAIPLKEYCTFYMITNPIIFGEMLFQALKIHDREVSGIYLSKVIYGGVKDLIVEHREDLKKLKGHNISEAMLTDTFLKPIEYKDNQEYRYIILTQKSKLGTPFTITLDVNVINKCCQFS